jgi:hypothetical protein
MKLEHLGKLVDIDQRQATCENRIVLMLAKHGSVRKTHLFHLTSSGKLGRDVFENSVQRLTEEEIVTLKSTANVRRIVLKLTPWGEAQAQTLEQPIAIQRPALEKPLQPEAA